MALTAPKAASKTDIPKGNFVARLYQIIHIGTVSYQWQGEEKQQDKIRLTFELCNERKVFKEGEDPQPFSISREFGFSMGKKSKLRPFVEGMLGIAFHDEEAYAFDIEELLGEACLLNVVHVEKNGNVYAEIQGASQLPKGMEAPELQNEKKLIDVNTVTDAEIEALPGFLQEKMKSSEEYKKRGGGLVVDINPDDLPF
jgi:hypothetical protein